MEESAQVVRPTKKQKELLEFIRLFIEQHGYSPSYREIMNGVGYTSVATVALHINNLIKRGHLYKRDHSARSLELASKEVKELMISHLKASEEKWIVERIAQYFEAAEMELNPSQKTVDELFVLVGALKVFRLDSAAISFYPRLKKLREKAES